MMAGMPQELYTGGVYLEKNPLWHTDESPWKAKYVLRMMAKNGIAPKTICDVGCGAGEVLRLVQEGMDDRCTFGGTKSLRRPSSFVNVGRTTDSISSSRTSDQKETRTSI